MGSEGQVTPLDQNKEGKDISKLFTGGGKLLLPLYFITTFSSLHEGDQVLDPKPCERFHEGRASFGPQMNNRFCSLTMTERPRVTPELRKASDTLKQRSR